MHCPCPDGRAIAAIDNVLLHRQHIPLVVQLIAYCQKLAGLVRRLLHLFRFRQGQAQRLLAQHIGAVA